jgi:broad specificity phosphatase PhoE
MAAMEALRQIWLIRHGETEWSLSGAHTGLTDLPLTANGELQATAIAHNLSGQPFSLVLTSPLQRARETCRLAGYAKAAELDSNLLEWDYGDYEGLSTPQIRLNRPDWYLWRDGVPNGETIDEVAARAKIVIDRCLESGGNSALFAHGHVLRILTATWLGLPPEAGRLFALSTATISVLAFERDQPVISHWNQS